MVRYLRNTTVVLWLLVSMAITTISMSLLAASLATQVANLTASTAQTVLTQRKAIAKVKAKARLRRLIAAVPFAGMASLAYFEEQDYQEWLVENPTGSRADYACEVAAVTSEVIDEFLRELPENLQPEPHIFNHLIETHASC